MINNYLWRLIFTVSISFPLVSTADNTNWRENRLIQLQKVTVGPWDNFEASVTLDDSTAFFTRDRNQILNIYTHNLETKSTNAFIGNEGDAKQAVLSHGGTSLAITYYKFDAQGDICIVKLPVKTVDCIRSKDTVDESPFWIDEQHIGYLSRVATSLVWELIVYNIITKRKYNLYKGSISAPVASPDGNYILYNEVVKQGKLRLHLYNRRSKKRQTLTPFDLPGISGFIAFSTDGRFLYFNHYLNDTNHDQIIDGNDNSVVFRVEFNKLLNSVDTILPEQLTSIENNCKFPNLSNSRLYVTCAFEGSLDIYQLPVTGMVPANWDEGKIKEAHLVARSNEERLLLLNALRFRTRRNDSELLERLLSNHLEIGEFTAANYYINQLASRNKHAENNRMSVLYESLAQLLTVRSSKQRVPVNIITTRFTDLIEKTRQQLSQLPMWPRLQAIIAGYFAYELEQSTQAEKELKKFDLSEPMQPIERYLAFDLYRLLFEKNQSNKLLRYYPIMFNDKSIPLEANIYYVFEYLKLMTNVIADPNQRIEIIDAQINSLKLTEVAQILTSEVLAIKLSLSQKKAQKNMNFIALTELLKKYRDNLLVRKAMHTRAIEILGAANMFQYMELLSRHWLVSTNISEMEFVNVAEQYSIITLNKAYDMLGEGNASKAYATFYSAIRQTNNLESHNQFINVGLTPNLNKRKNLDKSYSILEKQQILGGNINYVKALRMVLDSSPNSTHYEEDLDTALTLLQKIPQNPTDKGVGEMLIAYIYHLKLLNSKSGFNFTEHYYQKAHYHYMMALDSGRDNIRITTAVWGNLGWLHHAVRQFALSADFFTKRVELPFPDKDSELVTRWALARSLFYSNQYNAAWQQSEDALALSKKINDIDVKPFVEKTAFYAMQAGAYKEAAEYYEKIVSEYELNEINRAKTKLAYSYVLIKLDRKEDAITNLTILIDELNNLQYIPVNNTQLLAFHPQRLSLLALGFLINLTDEPIKRIDYLQSRIQIIQDMEGKTREYAYEESGRLSFLCKDLQKLAVAFESSNNNPLMLKAVQKALTIAELWRNETNDDIGPVVYRTIINYLSLALSHQELFKTISHNLIEQSSARVLKVLTEQKYRSSTIVIQQAKLAILWQIFQHKILLRQTGDLSNHLENILNSKELQKIRSDRNREYVQLQAISQNLQ